MEAFSDGVIAIIITIMVLGLQPPHGNNIHALRPLIPTFLTYVLSFVYLGIYWNNHHHLIRATNKVTGVILWANLHLLFWLTLFPFFTSWIGSTHFAVIPVLLYGVDLLLAAIAFYTLQQVIMRSQGENSLLRHAVGSDVKGKLSLFLYSAGILVTNLSVYFAMALYILVAIMWFIPDRRIETHMDSDHAHDD